MKVLIAIVVLIGVLTAGYWLKTLIWGVCPYCKSRDFVPDEGLYFYCNGCRRKF